MTTTHSPADDCIETPARNTRGHLFQIIDMSDWPIKIDADESDSRWNRLLWTLRNNAHDWYEAHRPDHDHATCEAFNDAAPILWDNAWEIQIDDENGIEWIFRFFNAEPTTVGP